jgi:hypothetical protein
VCPYEEIPVGLARLDRFEHDNVTADLHLVTWTQRAAEVGAERTPGNAHQKDRHPEMRHRGDQPSAFWSLGHEGHANQDHRGRGSSQEDRPGTGVEHDHGRDNGRGQGHGVSH